jgi:hypothetical protein
MNTRKMKSYARFKARRMLVALVAVFAISAVATATASAALPEFKPVPTKKKFTSTSGAVTWTAGTERLTCSSSATTGEITGASTLGDVVIKFTGCQQLNTKGTCPLKSVGANAGEIVTDSLNGELGTVATKEATSGVGILLAPTTGSTIARIAATPAPCSGTETALQGNVAGEVATTSKKQMTNKLVFGVTSGDQNIKRITVKSGTKSPELEAWGREWTIATTDEVAFEEALEVT